MPTLSDSMTGTIIIAAPNGARRSKSDHKALPLSPDEIASEALACRDAGASILHLHVRGAKGGHSLSPDLYKEAIKAVREKAGEDIIIQISTEAAGLYSPEEQMAIVRQLRPEAVSITLREIGADGRAAEFFSWMKRENIWPQFIHYNARDVRRFAEMHQQGLIPFSNPFLLFVLGSYEGAQAKPSDLDEFLTACIGHEWPWAVCAFGMKEAEIMAYAVKKGGHMRVGFENNLYLPDGELAPDNAALVKIAADIARKQSRPPLSADEIRLTIGE